jgi:hypothetical protein
MRSLQWLALLCWLARGAHAHGDDGWEVLSQCTGWQSLNPLYQARARASQHVRAEGICSACAWRLGASVGARHRSRTHAASPVHAG